MVVDRPPRRRVVAAVDVRRLVADLRRAGEPALLQRIHERVGVEPGRALGPEPHAGVLHQPPGVLEGVVVGVVALGDRAVDLDAARGDGQVVIAGGDGDRRSVDLDPDARAADRGAERVTLLDHVQQLDLHFSAVRKHELADFSPIQVKRAERGLLSRALLVGRGRREGRDKGKKCQGWHAHRRTLRPGAGARKPIETTGADGILRRRSGES